MPCRFRQSILIHFINFIKSLRLQLSPRVWFWVLNACLLNAVAVAQVCVSPGKDGPASLISGVVNTYYQPAVGTYSAGASIGLSNPVGATTAIGPGDLVLIMQMQCVAIDTTNTANYGAGNGTGRGYTDPAAGCRAGQYEYVRVGPGSSATSLDLSASPLVNTYSLDAEATPNRKTFQVIRVPQYASASLGGTVTSAYWTGITGGVVAVDVTGNLNLNGASIDVTGRGFRGAGGSVWNNTAATTADYVITTDITSNVHAMKAEGIAGTPRLVLDPSAGAVVDLGAAWGGYLNGSQGRGAPGNAGGGGDNLFGARDNGGGGGGANGGDGGFGGYGWRNGTWVGVSYAADGVDLRGIGGGAFNQRAPGRLVMGGGGGAGSNNNSAGVNSSGGAGGGIVLVRTGSASGNGVIQTNGLAGLTQVGNDGGGGGGAAGSVAFISTSGLLGAIAIDANGGAGGDGNRNGADAHAGGGGGAGGVVFTSAAATISTQGGINGITSAVDSPPDGTRHGASSGASGVSAVAITALPAGTSPGASCLPVLTVAKSTSTPLVTLPGNTTAQYVVTIANAVTAGTAYGVALRDVLPVPFVVQGVAATATTAFAGANTGGPSPATPNQSGTTSVAVFGVAGSANRPVVPSFTIAPGGSVTLTFVVNVNTSTLATFQNSAEISFTDPTRITGGPAEGSATVNPVATPGGTFSNGAVVGGSNYTSGSSAAEDVRLVGATVLSVNKTNGTSTLIAGSSTAYTVTFNNSGGFAADDAVIKDIPGAGLACTAVTCVFVTGGAACPAGLPLGSVVAASAIPNLFNGSGITLPTFPANSSVSLLVNCNTTATGQ